MNEEEIRKEAEQRGAQKVVDWINAHSFYGLETPQEGKPYAYLACYILNWGNKTDPDYALVELSEVEECQALLRDLGILARRGNNGE